MSRLKSLLAIPILTGLAILLLSGCYRMPKEDEYSVIPTTNNPDVCRDRSTPCAMPSAGF